eukprot:TRINITY_DN7211_c0_g1_i1.p1 TRINITY_DN7211_c0_g1~~TRINITY_DN7211_c0_g1_i1.p1  ORF type:complete len:251 (-),score=80.04 TRINITY_DN7211_c0_g1_i1:43-762(-)
MEVDTAAPAAAAPTRKRKAPTDAASAKRQITSATLTQLLSGIPQKEDWLVEASKPVLPTTEEYLNIVREDMDPENCVDPEYYHSNDSIFMWKFYRLFFRSHMSTMYNNKAYDFSIAKIMEAIDGKRPAPAAVPEASTTAAAATTESETATSAETAAAAPKTPAAELEDVAAATPATTQPTEPSDAEDVAATPSTTAPTEADGENEAADVTMAEVKEEREATVHTPLEEPEVKTPEAPSE